MRQGTNWPHGFTIPFDTSSVKEVLISYAQDYVEVFQKREKDCTMEGNHISVQITQEESFRLVSGKRLQVQLRLLTIDNEPLITKIFTVPVEMALNKEVL